jgi:HAE1 family hydrophobic/amphiphilic exporter-1
MIMASQFESLWQPFVIMFTVPFAIIGVAPALIMTHTSLNIIALLGLILLVGVVVNNAIVLIDFINSMRQEGKPIEEAAIESSKVRLRPILMTAFTSIIGLIPMAFSRGEGSELRVPMAITVMGGFTTSTILTLWVIPVLYVIVSKILGKFKKSGSAENISE